MGVLADEYIRLRADDSMLPKDVRRSGALAATNFQSSFAGTAKRLIKGGLVAIGVGAGLAFGAALKKGFGRLSAIEDAEAKLRGLGHSAKTVDKIMVNALASVKGTAFGLDEAATVAASAVAAGIKPGRDLERTLKLVADAATIGGTSLADMGAIFGQVAASNKIQGDTINQLNQRGIPILKLLADVTGKSQAEVSVLASKGKIDFATFQKAMEKGLGGAAVKSGETASGAWKNMGAAFARVGAALLKDVFPSIGKGIGGITEMLDGILPAATRIGEALGKVINSEEMKTAIDELKDAIQTLTGDEDIASSLTTMAEQIPKIIGGIADIITKYKEFADFVDKFEQDTFSSGDDVGGPIGWFIKTFKAGGTIEVALVHFRNTAPALAREGWANVKAAFTAEVASPVTKTFGAGGSIEQALIHFRTTAAAKVREAWADIKTGFISNGGIVNTFTSGFVARIGAKFGTMKDRVVDWVKRMWADTKTFFISNGGIVNTLTGGFVGRIGTWFGTMKGRVVTHVKTMWADAKASFLRTSGEILADVNRWKDKVVNAFSTAKANIKKLWDGLKTVVSAPINWIKDNVYNKPLVPVWNRVAQLVGGTKLTAYASGGVDPYGVRPGYTPGRDTHAILVGGGEAIMRPEFTRAVGDNWIYAANAAARRGVGSARRFAEDAMPGDPRRMPGFAGGGIVGWLGGLASNVSSKVGDLKDWALGGLRDLAGKLLDPVKTLIDKAMPNNGLGNTVGSLGKKAISLILDKIKTDDAAAMPAVGGPAGSAIASGGWASIYRALRAVGANSFTTYAGHDQGASRSRDIWPPSQRIADTARRLSSIWYVIYNRRIASKMHGNTWRPYTRSNPHTDHVHVTLLPGVRSAMGGIANFDMGGTLRPGLNLAYNGTGRDESLTPLRRSSSRGGNLDARLDRLIAVLEARGNEGLSLDLQVDVNTDEPRSIRLNRNLQKVGGGVGLVN